MKNHLFIKKFMMVLLTFAAVFSLVAPVMAREAGAASGGNKPVVSSQAQGPTDPEEMEEFMDGLFARQSETTITGGLNR